jgi:hypothetical protein
MSMDEASFRSLGPIDCTMVVKIGGPDEAALFEVTFEAFEVKSIRRIEHIEDAAPEHFVIEASLGGLDHCKVLRSMELMRDKVIPHLRDCQPPGLPEP